MTNETTTFQAGTTYSTRSIGDHNCIIEMTVIKRTAKTITANVKGDGIKTFRPYLYNNVETVRPWGSFSMAPSIGADDTKKLTRTWEQPTPAASSSLNDAERAELEALRAWKAGAAA